MVVYQCLSVISFLIIILKFVSGTYSDPYSQEVGVPQGSILSVTLFSLKINSIVSCLLLDIKCFLYVYDIAIYYSSSHVLSINRKLQHSLNRLGRCVMRMVLSFHQQKRCVSILVANHIRTSIIICRTSCSVSFLIRPSKR